MNEQQWVSWAAQIPFVALIVWLWLKQSANERADRDKRDVTMLALAETHRTERKERDADWRGFLDAQRKEFGATVERVVGEFRGWVTTEREEYTAELRKVSDALKEHDARSALLAERIGQAAQGAVVTAAASAAAATVKEIRNADRATERQA